MTPEQRQLAASHEELLAALAEAEANLACLKNTLAETVAIEIRFRDYPTFANYIMAMELKKQTVDEIETHIREAEILISSYHSVANSIIEDRE